MPDSPKDLVILTACKDAKVGIEAFLTEPEAGVRSITYECYSHPKRDSGCRKASEFLRPFLRSFKYALVVLDREGSGMENLVAESIESEIEGDLGVNGWDSQCAVVVIDPELEAWIWDRSLSVRRILSSHMTREDLMAWLLAQGFPMSEGNSKLERPKEAFRELLRATKTPVSSALFGQFARSAKTATCQDRSFVKLRATLQSWFPPI
jgi:hypothetical protein